MEMKKVIKDVVMYDIQCQKENNSFVTHEAIVKALIRLELLSDVFANTSEERVDVLCDGIPASIKNVGAHTNVYDILKDIESLPNLFDLDTEIEFRDNLVINRLSIIDSLTKWRLESKDLDSDLQIIKNISNKAYDKFIDLWA